ncbi:hypothetical protein [Streptomyces sp. NPDC126514]|uniref:hypothetical protein n=1 Tax=Streptomyces sp. NPDC126514 TaxID=3155210 RepID=UPI003318AFFD
MTDPAAALQTSSEVIERFVELAGPACTPATDMADLADMVRTLLAVEAGRDTWPSWTRSGADMGP